MAVIIWWCIEIWKMQDSTVLNPAFFGYNEIQSI